MRLKSFKLAFFAMAGLFCTAAYARAHSVNLTWTASSDAGVSYNVYRLSGACPSTGTSGFSKITAAPVTATTYTDGSAVPGAYCYYATSVLNGAESGPSNLVSTVILPAAPTALSVSGTN